MTLDGTSHNEIYCNDDEWSTYSSKSSDHKCHNNGRKKSRMYDSQQILRVIRSAVSSSLMTREDRVLNVLITKSSCIRIIQL